MVQTVLAAVVTPGTKVKVVTLHTLPPDSKHPILLADITQNVSMLDACWEDTVELPSRVS
jgi:hypothetical protein